MATWSEVIEDQIFKEAADLSKLERDTMRSVLEPALEEARDEMAQLIDQDWGQLTQFNRQRIAAFSEQLSNLLNQIGLDPVEQELMGLLQDLVIGTYEQAAKEINTVVELPLISIEAPPSFFGEVADTTLIEGQPLFTYERVDGSPGWWNSLKTSTQDRMARDVRKSLVLGETPAQAIQRLLGTRRGQINGGTLGLTKRQAEAFMRTSIHAVTNATRTKLYEANSDIVEGVKSLATLDSRTTVLCRAYDGLRWSLPDYKPIGHGKSYLSPPRHWRCRSVMQPILAGLEEIDQRAREMGLELEPTVIAARDGPRQRTSATGNMDGWMRSQSIEEQNAMLGKGRAELWREGKFTLQQLVNARGELIPISELKKIAEKRSATRQVG